MSGIQDCGTYLIVGGVRIRKKNLNVGTMPAPGTSAPPTPQEERLPRMLKVFLSYAFEDQAPVLILKDKLSAYPIDVWLDQDRLFPGMEWKAEIKKAMRTADAIVLCLSEVYVSDSGYRHDERRYALELAAQQPDGAIFLLPAKLGGVVIPDSLEDYQWADKPQSDEREFSKLLVSLRLRAEKVGARALADHPRQN